MRPGHWIDLAIVALFGLYGIFQGFRARRRASRSMEEFLLAGRSLSGWQAGISMAATQFAADTPLLVMGLVAAGGLFSLWRLWIYALAFLLMGFLLGHAWRRAGVLTDAELTEIRYESPLTPYLRYGKAIYYGLIINCTVIAMVLVAALRIFEIFLPWHLILPEALYAPFATMGTLAGPAFASGLTGLDPQLAGANNLISLIVLFVFVGLYATTGGLRGVVATDTAQFAVMMIATAIYAGLVLIKTGGPGELTASLVERYGQARAGEIFSFAPADALHVFLVLISIQWLFQISSDGTGYLAQRTMAARDDREARKAALIFTFAQVLFRSLLWVPIALALLVLYPFEPGASGEAFLADRELTFVRGMDELLPAGVRGLLLTGMLAALASTIDTHLNWGASYLAGDLYRDLYCKRIRGRDVRPQDTVRAARVAGLLIIAGGLLILTRIQSIQTAWQLTLLFGAGMGAVLLLRWFWERINVYSEFAAIACSLLIAPLLLATVDAEWLRITLMALGSTIAVLAVTLITRPTPEATRTAFYRRVRPPGFWRQTARLAGESPDRAGTQLRAGLVRIALGAGSLFLLLYGAIRIVFPLPGSEGTRLAGAFAFGIGGWLFYLLIRRMRRDPVE